MIAYDTGVQYQIHQNNSLQNLIDIQSEEGNLDNILDTIFTFYEDFLNDSSTYQQQQQLAGIDSDVNSISNSSSSSSIFSSKSSQEDYNLSSNSYEKPFNSLDHQYEIKKSSHTTNNRTTENKTQLNKMISNNDMKKRKLVTENNKQSTKKQSIDIPMNSTISQQTVNIASIQRLTYLLKVPNLITQAINTGDHEFLESIINEAFLPNCKLMTRALTYRNGIIGRQYVLEMYKGITRMVPDFMMNILPSTINHRVISTKIFTSGTCFKKDDPSDYLFNHLKHGPNDGVYEEAKQNLSLMNQQHKPVTVTSKSVIHLVLNEEKTHVETFKYSSKVTSIKESNVVIT